MRKQAWSAATLFVMLAVTALLMLGGCGNEAPELTSITPSSGTPGSRVTLNGVNFGDTQEGSYVRFGSQTAMVYTWSDTSIEIMVPAETAAGAYQISVEMKRDVSNSLQFEVTNPPAPAPTPPPKPQISSILPASGMSGAQVSIYGENFGSSRGSGKVNLGPVEFEVVSWSDVQIDVKVPPSMGTGQYEVTVQNANGTSNTIQFIITAQ